LDLVSGATHAKASSLLPFGKSGTLITLPLLHALPALAAGAGKGRTDLPLALAGLMTVDGLEHQIGRGDWFADDLLLATGEIAEGELRSRAGLALGWMEAAIGAVGLE
jgi:hypothetical protein